MKRKAIILAALLIFAGTPVFANDIPKVDSSEELVKKAPAAETEAFLTIDVNDSADNLSSGVSEEVNEIIETGESDKEKAEAIAECLEDSGLYSTEVNGDEVEATALFACQRIRLDVPYGNIDTYGGNAVFYDDHFLITYDSEEATKEAYEKLCDKYGDKVILDMPIKADAIGWGSLYMGLEREKAMTVNSSTVAVLDTGINKNHEIFKNTEILDGYNYVGKSANVTDDDGHGTAVAGIVAESANVKIMPIKILNNEGTGSMLNIYYGLEYAGKHGADIANLSLGGYCDTQAEFDKYGRIFGELINKYGLIVVCASGNESKDMDTSGVYEFPGEYDFTICVGAINNKGNRCVFSNYGKAVDFAAPGDGITAANYKHTTYYANMSGTSFSAPYISAAAAIVKSNNSDYGISDVKDELASISKDLGDEGKDRYYGYGCPVFEADISQATVAPIADKTYNGKEQTPKPVVTLNGATLKEGQDYSLAYASNVNAGEATITITGTGSCKGETSAKFKIVPKSIIPSITLKESVYVWDGQQKTPTVTVKDGNTVLDAGNYEVTLPEKRKDVGTYEVGVALKGNYAGSGTAYFEIVEDTSVPVAMLSNTSYIYDGSVKTPEVTVQRNGAYLVEGSDYSVEYPTGRTNVGKYEVKITLASGSVLRESFVINAKEVNPTVTLSCKKYEYDGKQKNPVPTVTDGGTLLSKNDYEIKYPNGRTDAGTYTVNVVLKGNYIGSGEDSFVIEPKTVTPNVEVTQKGFIYNGREQFPKAVVTYYGNKLSDYSETHSGGVEAGVYTVDVNLKGNYRGSGQATFVIYKANNTVWGTGKTVKVSRKKLRKRAQTVSASSLMNLHEVRGGVSYYYMGASKKSKYFSIDRNTGALRIKKKLKKGTYRITVNVTASGDKNYSPGTATITYKVKVK